MSWDIETLKRKEKLADTPILLAHAWCGCDTTSAIHNKGKVKILLYLKDKKFRENVNVFGKLESSADEIKLAATKITLKLYGGKDDDNLASLRRAKFKQMVAEKSKFHPEDLPPTERAIFFHALRVHLQVCVWKQLDLHCLDPLDWGWQIVNDELVPVKTDIEAAPDYLLNVVRCNCKTTSARTCDKNTNCSCQKNGLRCVSACGDCRGVSCCNMSHDRRGIEMCTDEGMDVGEDQVEVGDS